MRRGAIADRPGGQRQGGRRCNVPRESPFKRGMVESWQENGGQNIADLFASISLILQRYGDRKGPKMDKVGFCEVLPCVQSHVAWHSLSRLRNKFQKYLATSLPSLFQASNCRRTRTAASLTRSRKRERERTMKTE